MQIIGVIPARYASTRFPGKPLADICGKPMIWWVYQQVIKVPEFTDVVVATDDDRIVQVCNSFNIKTVMTNADTPNHIHRIWEVSNKIVADYYVSINGDEPLIKAENVKMALPEQKYTEPYFQSVYKDITDPAELIDISNVKIVLGKNKQCLYQSRLPIPSTKGSILFKYKKAIGIECFNKPALDAFVSFPMGELEKIEDIDHLRFLENGIPIIYEKIDSVSLSVDTPKDLEKVRKIISQNKEMMLNE